MDSPRLTVASVLWVGQFRGRNYGPDWVRRLRNMVARNLPIPHRFVCLSNVDVEGVETIPLTGQWPGWWSKVELFRHDFGRTLYLDLDVLVVDGLTPIAQYPAPFAAMPPSYTFTGGSPAGGPGIVDRYQSSCMVWDCDMRPIYERFGQWAIDKYRGDQDYLSDVYPNGETMPPEWFQKLKKRTNGPQG